MHSCRVGLTVTPSLSGCVETLSLWEGGGGGLLTRHSRAGRSINHFEWVELSVKGEISRNEKKRKGKFVF